MPIALITEIAVTFLPLTHEIAAPIRLLLLRALILSSLWTVENPVTSILNMLWN